MNDYKTHFTNVYEQYGTAHSDEESHAGADSMLDATRILRERIPQIAKQRNLKSIVDIPCSDFNWMKEIVFRFEKYIGGDIVPQCIIENNEKYSNSRIKFIEFDVLSDVIPDGDLLIVRDLLEYCPLEDGKKIIESIKKSNCKYVLMTTWRNINDNDYFKSHINSDIQYGEHYHINLMSEPFNLPDPEDYIVEDTIVEGYEDGVRKVLGLWNIEKLRNNIPQKMEIINKDLTVVTGLWNIGRQGREFTHYIEHFQKFLEIPVNMFIYIPKEYEYLVWEKRSKENTYVKIADLEYIKEMYAPFWDRTQSIRTNPNWLNMSGEGGWLQGSPQATLEYYNPIVQSKMFLLNDATLWNPFNTEYFIWLDAGITNTVYDKFFTQDRVLDKILPHLKQFLFLSYPYDATNEIHGFDFKAINKFAGQVVKYVCRGGLFGGTRDAINIANSTYYSTLDKTLNGGYMGTEESIFAIMAYREPHVYRRYALDGNGLITKFIENLLIDNIELEEVPKRSIKQATISNYELQKIKTNLYILTFNFPDQLQFLLTNMEKTPEWLTKPHLVLIDNSTDEKAVEGNKIIAEKYKFEYIWLSGNTGICGGRQAASDHFHDSDADFMLFFQDDMTINPKEFEGQFCRNGFRKYIPNLYDTIHKIMMKENFDFLKLSFTEVYFDNDRALPWYNVPQHIRTRDWPEYDQLPITGLDPNSPHTKYQHVKVYDGLSYLTGEINYSDWPMIQSKEGNKKMFIDTKWAHPYEQTWSSHIYQLTKDGQINSGLLLAAPIWHERILYYKPEERREN